MARTPKVRLVLLVSPSIAQRYMALAERFRFSRNEVCRYALDHGYAATVAWCRRTEAIFTDEVDASDGSVQRPLPSVFGNRSSAPLVAGAGDDPGVALRRYAEVVVSQDSDLDPSVFRAMVAAQAVVLGLSPVVSSPLVDAIVLEHFPGGVEAGGAAVLAGSDVADPPGSAVTDVDENADADTLPELDPSVPVVELD